MRPHALTDALQKWATTTPGNTALVWKEEVWTYSYLNQQANRLANVFMGSPSKGRFVCGFLGKTPELVVSFLAASKAGLVYLPFNTRGDLNNLAAQLGSLDPAWVIVEFDYFEFVYSALRLAGISRQTSIILCSSKSGAINDNRGWHNVISKAQSKNPNIVLRLSDPVYFNYTSGTTGQPKGAITTHENIFWNSMSAIKALRLRRTDVHLCAFPSYLHPHEIFSRPLYLGGALVLAEPEIDQLWKAVRDNKVSCMMANPSVYSLLSSYAKKRGERLYGLRLTESGGSITRSSLVQLFKRDFGTHMVPVWGSTETAGVAIAAYHYPQKAHKGFLGKVCPFYEVAVVTDSEKPTKEGEVGELLVRGPAVTRGYFNLKDESKRKFQRDWYRTGDLVCTDRGGRIYFQGRIHNMIKVGGLKVYPEEIERVLSEHPRISEVGVVGYPNEIRGEEIHAFIVLKSGEELWVKDVIKFCHHKLEDHKIPRIITFLPRLPRNRAGKVDSSELSRLILSNSQRRAETMN